MALIADDPAVTPLTYDWNGGDESVGVPIVILLLSLLKRTLVGERLLTVAVNGRVLVWPILTFCEVGERVIVGVGTITVAVSLPNSACEAVCDVAVIVAGDPTELTPLTFV